MQTLYAADILYVVSVGLSKCSAALFLGSLTSSTKQRMVGRIVAFVCACWTIGSGLVVALRGDITKPWALPHGTSMMVRSSSIREEVSS